MNMKLGILLQGRVTEWTPYIIEEYQTNFPESQILLSTWETENVEVINCDVIKSKAPEIAGKQRSTVNFQIVGTQAGLKKINADVILKCRTDQFIHNRNIFQIYFDYAFPERIMVPDYGTYEIIKYRTSDFCQIATKQILDDFWLKIPKYDPKNYEESGVYLTKNYLQNIKNELDPWEEKLRKYFCVKSYFDDFQIEWEKLNQIDEYQEILYNAFSQRALSE